jgi:hypothetical protein
VSYGINEAHHGGRPRPSRHECRAALPPEPTKGNGGARGDAETTLREALWLSSWIVR